jgi:DNA polymerase
VGEAPGRTENDQGRPLIGPAGKLLDQTLAEYGMDLDTICYFNVVSCFPQGPPTPESIRACEIHFLNQFRLADPKYVLLLGNYALQAFIPGASIMSSRGTWWEDAGKTFLPTVHPAGVLRNEEWRPLFNADIKEFVRRVQCT